MADDDEDIFGDDALLAGPEPASSVVAVAGEEEGDLPLRHYRAGAPPMLRLYRCGGVQRLENLLTGEVVDLEVVEPGPWSLRHCPEGYGYVEAGGKQVWANVLFKQVLYNCEEGIYMQVETPGGDVLTEWLSDARLKCSSSYASWAPSSEHCGVPKLTIVSLAAPAANGRQNFLNLGDIQEALDFTSAYARTHKWFSKSVGTWERLLAEHGCDPSELVRPLVGDQQGELCLQKWHGSSAATLLILVHHASHMKEEEDRVRCRKMLRGLLVHLLEASSFQMNVHISGDAAQCQMEVQDFVIRQIHPPHRHCARMSNMFLGDALVHLYQLKVSVFRDLLKAIALQVDRSFAGAEWPQDPLQCLTRGGARRRIERGVRQVLGELPMSVARNQYRAGKLLTRLGVAGSHRSWVDIAFMRRYLLGLRRSCGESSSYCFASDKSRGSGRDWLSTAVLAHEESCAGWLQPVASRGAPRNSQRTLCVLSEVCLSTSEKWALDF